MDNFSWMEDWFSLQCDGDWEHGYGVTIKSLDNPGWSVVIDLNDTRDDEIQNRDLIHDLSNEVNWISCKIQDGKFLGYGSEKMLGKIVQIFRKWIEEY